MTKQQTQKIKNLLDALHEEENWSKYPMLVVLGSLLISFSVGKDIKALNTN